MDPGTAPPPPSLPPNNRVLFTFLPLTKVSLLGLFRQIKFSRYFISILAATQVYTVKFLLWLVFASTAVMVYGTGNITNRFFGISLSLAIFSLAQNIFFGDDENHRVVATLDDVLQDHHDGHLSRAPAQLRAWIIVGRGRPWWRGAWRSPGACRAGGRAGCRRAVA